MAFNETGDLNEMTNLSFVSVSMGGGRSRKWYISAAIWLGSLIKASTRMQAAGRGSSGRA